MMDNVDRILDYVKRTNPEMTRDRLVECLGKSRYSAASLVMVWENAEKACKTQA